MFLCIAVGEPRLLDTKAKELQDQGYRMVPGPDLKPLQYCQVERYLRHNETGKIIWAEPEAANG